MATSTPARARGRATRARLVSAGVREFSRRGFHATRVDDIVRRAKTSHGTFYLYFSSKDDLFEQLVSEVAAEFDTLTESLPEVRDDEAGREALAAWLLEFIGLYRSYGSLIRSWTDAETPEPDDSLPDLLGPIAAGLAARVRVRATKNFDPGIAALAVVAMVERLNYLLATGQVGAEDAGPDDATVAAALAAIALDAFFGPGH